MVVKYLEEATLIEASSRQTLLSAPPPAHTTARNANTHTHRDDEGPLNEKTAAAALPSPFNTLNPFIVTRHAMYLYMHTHTHTHTHMSSVMSALPYTCTHH